MLELRRLPGQGAAGGAGTHLSFEAPRRKGRAAFRAILPQRLRRAGPRSISRQEDGLRTLCRDELRRMRTWPFSNSSARKPRAPRPARKKQHGPGWASTCRPHLHLTSGPA